MRLHRTLWALPTALTLALCASGAALAAHKIVPQAVPESWTLAVLIGAAISVVGTLAVAWFRQLPPHAGALALDRYHALHGRLTNAIEFLGESEERSPMMDLAIDDACDKAGDLKPRHAVMLSFPPELYVSAGVAAAVLTIALLEVPIVNMIAPPPKVASFKPLELQPDDLALFRQAIEEMSRDEQSPDVKEAIERFNQLIEDIADRRLNREEAFRKMEEIENDLLKGAEADKKALDDALKDTASELEKSPISKPIADAMKKNDLKKAAEEAKKVAETLRKDKKPNKAELERLRKALEKAVKQKQKALDEINEQRAAMRQDLLKQKDKKDDKDKPKTKEEKDKEKNLLNKKKRQLERLDRTAKRKERALRRLSKLDRDLAKAAQDLLRELGASADDFEKIAEDINRLQQEQMSDKDKEELRKRLEEMRERIRQDGQGGKKMRERLKRFLNKAGGGNGKLRPGKGQRGQQGKGGRPGKQGQGQRPGQGKGQGEGKGKGKGQGEGQGEGQGSGQMGLGQGQGPGSIPIPMPGQGQGSGDGDQPGDGSGKGGKEWGTGKGGDPKGEATPDLKADNTDVRAEAVDNKAGPTNAEVILSAAERGFVGKPYQQVFKRYKTHAEAHIDTEKIPDGMRFYVRRYFDLIRPRE